MRYLYNLLFYILLPLIPIRLYLRSRKNPAYLTNWQERFSHYHTPILKNAIWIHAVSLGEAIAAIPLIKELKNNYPNKHIVVTTMTPTGREKIKTTFSDQVSLFYAPYDYPGAVQRFLNYTNPNLLIIMETELWPNILHYTAKRHIPIFLVNARLSPSSFRGYSHVKFFMREMFSDINTVLAQSKEDGDRFLDLGLDPKKLIISGNIKFDIDISKNIDVEAKNLVDRLKLDTNRPIWIAASTHRGEEEKILISAKQILIAYPNSLLILVPRHPERFDEVAILCKKQGFSIARYSENSICLPNTQIFIGDTIGKLLPFYKIANVAFVGGSLVPVGGHNLLEPAALNIPIITGSNLVNFKEISNLLSHSQALIVVKNETELAINIIELFSDTEKCKNLAAAASKVIIQNKGALNKILRTIHPLIS